MHDSTLVDSKQSTLNYKVKINTKESLNDCYQCGKCSAGCPLIDEMDIPPNQIIRMLQLEMPELDKKVLESYSIWLCLTCETCYSRCPKDVNLPEIMDFLRAESIKRNLVNPKAKDILAFHRSFLNSIQATGRLYEVGLIAGYKMKTFHLLQDVNSVPSLLSKGKLKLLPKLIKDRKELSEIFKKTKEHLEDK